MKTPEQRYSKFLQNVQKAAAANCLHDPSILADLNASLCHLRQGQIAAKACRRLEGRLFRRLVAAALAGKSIPDLPAYDPADSVPLGTVIETGSLLWRPLKSWTGHVCCVGATGSGKTNAETVLLDRFVEKGIQAIAFARKEAGRLLLRYPDAILLRPPEWPVNFLQPIGNPNQYFAELAPILARGVGARSDYIPKLLETLMRTHSSVATTARGLSLKRLESVLRSLGARGDRRCETLAAALSTFNLFLGDTARIESAPQWEDRHHVIILDREGAPPTYRACLDGLMQLRFQAQAVQQGYTQDLRRVIFHDEAGLELGREFDSQAGSNAISTAKREITQMRSYGVGLFLSYQSFGQVSQDVKDNTNTVIAFRTLSPEDVRELGYRMNLTDPQKQRLPLQRPGRALVTAPDLPCAVEVQFDYADLGPYPPESQISARMAPVLQEFRQNTVYTQEAPIVPLDVDELLGETEPAVPAPEHKTLTPSFNGNLLANHLAFLRDIAQFPESGVAARLHRLAFGGSKGSRIKQELIDLGLLEVIEVRKSAVGAPTKVLHLTELARNLPAL